MCALGHPVRPGERGVSLVELMLLLAACAVFVGALLSGIVQLAAQRQHREERMLAMNACRSALEDLRRDTIEELQAADGRGFAVTGIGGSGTGLRPRPGDPDGFPGRITVAAERTYGAETLYRVAVAVEWSGFAPDGRVRITTLMGKRR